MADLREELAEKKAELAGMEQALEKEKASFNEEQKRLAKEPASSAETGEEAEKAAIYKAHFEATQAEVDAMTMEQYKAWSALGGHFKKPLEEVQRDIAVEERDRAQAAELEKMDSMTMEEYVAYQKEQERKAQADKEAAARLSQQERQGKINELRHKRPEDMSMAEYEAWTKIR